MRSRTSFLAFFFITSFFALPLAAQAAIPFFGPIISPEISRCAAGWGAVITVINNIIQLLITLAIVIVAPLMIAYSGFLYVVNPVSSEGISKARGILTNTVIGIVIALAGWLIVDAIMAALYRPENPGQAWSQIIKGNNADICLPLKESLSQSALRDTTGVSTGTLNSVSSGNVIGTACDPAAVQAAAAAGDYTLTNAQANTLACIAKPESSCGSNLINYKWGSGSSAVGAFQVLLQNNAVCYENKACTDALGLPRGTKLNCATGFKGGNPISGSAVAVQCVEAAANLNCSASAAACLIQKTGGFSPWQQDVNSAVQSGCINKGI